MLFHNSHGNGVDGVVGVDGLTFTTPNSAKSRRSIKLTRNAVEALRRHRNRQAQERMALDAGLWRDNALMFPTKFGTPLDVADLTYGSFRPLLKRAGPSSIRMLGHASITVTLDTYSHVLPYMQDQPVSAMESALS